jgi:hypothetical protein
MNISLPDVLQLIVESQARRAGKSTEEYALQLVLEGLDRNRQDADILLREALAENGNPASVSDEALQQRKREIEAKLLAALDSGDPVEVTPALWEERRRILEERLARQGKAKGS